MNENTNTFPVIALSHSGGGYRAAAFHLGTLEMLERLCLLDNVSVLSTVSGGTITGAAYATAVAENLPFREFSARCDSECRRETKTVQTVFAFQSILST